MSSCFNYEMFKIGHFVLTSQFFEKKKNLFLKFNMSKFNSIFHGIMFVS